MAAKYRTASSILFLALTLAASAQDKPKKNPFKAVGHWISHHKKVVVITGASALASGLAYNAVQSGPKPVVNLGPAVPCPSSACITVPH